MAHDDIVALLRREFDPAELHGIREEWKRHSMAEDRRDLPGLLATLTPDCVYEVVPAGARWDGHEGTARFYTELLTAFPDITFDLTDIVHRESPCRMSADIADWRRGRRLVRSWD